MHTDREETTVTTDPSGITTQHTVEVSTQHEPKQTHSRWFLEKVYKTVPAFVSAGASAALYLAGSKDYKEGFQKGRETGENYAKQGSNNIPQIPGIDKVCSPFTPSIETFITASGTLWTAMYFFEKAGHNFRYNQAYLKYLLAGCGVLTGGTLLITMENGALVSGCVESNGYLNGFATGFNYACTQNSNDFPNCKDAPIVNNPNKGLYPFDLEHINSSAAKITGAVILGGAGAFFGAGSFIKGYFSPPKTEEEQTLISKEVARYNTF